MHKTMRTTYKLLSLWLLSALLFQGCAAYPPARPVRYPAPIPEVKKQPIPEQPIPEADPGRQAPKQSNIIAASFSRQAGEQTRQGRLDLAAATLERGLRAAPKDAMLWSQLAEVQLQQQHYEQARSLAAKSNSLAGTNTTLVEKNRWIIKEALKRAAAQ